MFDNATGAARAGASEPLLIQPSTNKMVGINRQDANNYRLWRPLGGRYWASYLVTRTGPDIPFNWAETVLEQVLAYKTAEEDGVTYTGPTAPLTSLSATQYVNGRGRRLDGAGTYVEVTFQGGGDLYAVFFGRDDGAHVSVTLNGKRDYLVLPAKGDGTRYFDAYSAAQAPKKLVQIASGVPEGSHTVRFEVTAYANSGNTGSNRRFWFNALGWDGQNTGPWTPETSANPWVSGESVLQNEERYNAGRWYTAEADGTTGNTPPTHSSGSVSDGGVAWRYRGNQSAASSYTLLSHRIQGFGSQLEYAYRIKPEGTTVLEDVGGFAHGNEVQSSYVWRVNGTLVDIPDNLWCVGETIEIQEKITARHSQINSSNTPVVETVLRRRFSRSWVDVSHEHVLLMAAQVGWFYAHMWPLMHYNAGGWGFKTGITEIWSPCDQTRYCEDYYYDPADPVYDDDSVAITKDYVMIARGDAYLPDGVSGAMSKGDTGLKFHAWLAPSGLSVGNYERGSRTFASKSMNTSDKNPLLDPASGMACKMYFMLFDEAGVALPAGEKIEARARYGLAITAS